MKLKLTLFCLLLTFTLEQVDAQTTIYFSNKNPRFCISNNWFDLGLATGAYPSGGYWTITYPGKQHCIDTSINSPTFGMVQLSCLGVTGTNGNPASWKLTYDYTDQFNQTSKDSIDLRIYPLPIVYAGADDSICYNAPLLQFFPYPNVGVGTEWLVPPSPPTNISHPSLPNPVLVYNPVPRTHFFYPKRGSITAQDTTYMLVYKATDPHTYCVNTDTVKIYVKPIPYVTAGQHPPVCEDAGILNLNTATGASPVNGTWSGPGISNGLFNPKDSGVQYGSANPNILTYTYTNAFNCTVTDTTTMVVHKLPLTKLTVSDSSVCETYSPFLMNGSPNGTGGKFFINGILNLTGIFNPADTLVVKGKPDSNKVEYFYKDPFTGCQKSDFKTIHVQRRPQVHIINPGPYYNGKPFMLHANKTHTGSWQWSTLGDGSFSTGGSTSVADSVGYTPGTNDQSNKLFSIVLTSTDNGICPAGYDTLKVGVWAVGMHEATPLAISVYPNPSSGAVFINFGDAQTHHVTLFDLLGREMLHTPLNSEQELNLQQYGLDKGLYLLQVDDAVTKFKILYR